MGSINFLNIHQWLIFTKLLNYFILSFLLCLITYFNNNKLLLFFNSIFMFKTLKMLRKTLIDKLFQAILRLNVFVTNFVFISLIMEVVEESVRILFEIFIIHVIFYDLRLVEQLKTSFFIAHYIEYLFFQITTIYNEEFLWYRFNFIYILITIGDLIEEQLFVLLEAFLKNYFNTIIKRYWR